MDKQPEIRNAKAAKLPLREANRVKELSDLGKGLSVNAPGQYPGMTGPSTLACVKNGEGLVNGKKFQYLFLNLRP
jgi:hypothetical protein